MFDQRFFKITIAVLLFHAGLLYLIQSGLARKMTEAVIAPEIIARIIPMEPPQQPPAPEPPKQQPQTPPKQVKVVTPRPTPPKPQPRLRPWHRCRLRLPRSKRRPLRLRHRRPLPSPLRLPPRRMPHRVQWVSARSHVRRRRSRIRRSRAGWAKPARPWCV
jgi:hypothetical protein